MNNNSSRHFKRVIAAAIVVTLASGAAPIQNFAPLTDMSITASADTTSGTVYYNSNAKWEWDPDTSTVTFSGTGSVSTYATTLINYKPYIKHVVIEEGITGIYASAFENCSKIETVTIPNTVTFIGGRAFSGCSSLKSVEIPDSVTTLGDSAFAYCSSLETAKISKNVTELNTTFSGCRSLTEVSVPNGVTRMSSTFTGCENLKTAHIPNGVTYISGCFYGCTSLEEIVIPESVETMNDAFINCSSLKSVVIPSGVVWMDGAFSGCTSLETINVPDGVKGVYNTFIDCTSLKEISLPDSVENMNMAFIGCTNLEKVNIPNGVTTLPRTFENCESLKSIIVPETVENMDQTFSGCTSLETVNIPDGITSLDGTFENCTSLKTISIPDNVECLGGFAGCTSLESFNFPSSITEIGENAFSGCTSLTSLEIPDTVTSIGYEAFCGCTGLTELTVPSNVKYIYGRAFYETNLSSVTFEGDEGIYFGYDAFGSLTDDVSVEVPKYSKGGSSDFYSTYILPDDEYEYSDANCKRYFGEAKFSIKDDNTYTKVEAVEPTCTKDGRYEYYIGTDGNYYRDACGYEMYDSFEETVWSALCHDEKVAWSWTKLSSGDYKAVAKFSCTRGDLDVTYVTATVTSEESDEGTTYHAVAACPLDEDMYSWHSTGHEVTYDYFVESTKYTVTAEGGSITEATKKDEYKSGDSVTVKADKEKDGAYFTGWYIGDKCVSTNPSYTFFVKEDTTITAKYEEQEAEQEAVNSLTLTRGEDNWKQKIKFSNHWSLPEGSKLVEAGVLRAYDKDISNVTPDTAKANGVTQNKSSLKTVNGTYNLTVNMSYETKQKTVYAKGYVIYTDANGKKHTQMTDMQTSAY